MTNEEINTTVSIELPHEASNRFQQLLDHAKQWCTNHPIELGAAEIALGATLLSTSLQHGWIEMGAQLIGYGDSNIEGLIGGGFGAAAGAGGAMLLGGIGVAAMGTAFGIPTVLLGAGAAVLLGAFGYSLGSALDAFLKPAVNPWEFGALTGLAAVGVALIVDGARRIIGSEPFQAFWAAFKNGCLILARKVYDLAIVTRDAVTNIAAKLITPLNNNTDRALIAGSTLAAGAGGGAIGASVAASSVTVLGSHTLGGAALSLGLVSAPIAPVVIGAAAAAMIGFAVVRSCFR